MDSYLVLRDKTLHLRMQRHCENGQKLPYLNEHPKLKQSISGLKLILFMKLPKNNDALAEWSL
jgi:O-acetylhomoserine/O-acetylserine sulfhydrylase-like pyridoxal-dependent enzyme